MIHFVGWNRRDITGVLFNLRLDGELAVWFKVYLVTIENALIAKDEWFLRPSLVVIYPTPRRREQHAMSSKNIHLGQRWNTASVICLAPILITLNVHGCRADRDISDVLRNGL